MGGREAGGGTVACCGGKVFLFCPVALLVYIWHGKGVHLCILVLCCFLGVLVG